MADQVDPFDVDPFSDLITLSGFQAEADINQKGAVDLLDISPFFELLNNG